MNKSYKDNLGVALITVMLIVALASVLATQMMGRLQLQMQRTNNVNTNQQAFWYAMGAEAFAKRVLITSFDGDEDVTNLEQMWAQGENSFPVDFGTITGEIFDLQACFNLNALLKNTGRDQNASNEKAIERQALEDLIVSMNIPDVSQFDAEYMVDALADWLDNNDRIVSPGGAEDNDYGGKEFPYLPANNFLVDISELRLIEHFNVKVINELKKYACVIPNDRLHQVNVNTVSAEQVILIEALLDIPSEDAEQAISARPEEGFKTVDEFFNLPEISKHDIAEDRKAQFGIDSQYFKLKTTASFNGSYFGLVSILKVATNNKINVISRTIGRD